MRLVCKFTLNELLDAKLGNYIAYDMRPTSLLQLQTNCYFFAKNQCIAHLQYCLVSSLSLNKINLKTIDILLLNITPIKSYV